MRTVHQCYTQRHLTFLFYIQNILILILVDALQFSILPGSGLLDPIFTVNFPTKRDLYNLKAGEGKEREEKQPVIHLKKKSLSLEDS